MPEEQLPRKSDIPRLLARLQAATPEQKADIEIDLIFAYFDADDYPKVIETYKACKDRIPERMWTEVVSKVSSAYEKYGELDDAQSVVLKRLHELEARGEVKSKQTARLHLRLAFVLMRKSRFDESVEHCQLAEAIFTEVEATPKDHIMVSSSLGMVMWEKGDYSQAIRFMEQARLLAEEAGLVDELSNIYNILGLVHYQVGKYVEALRLFGIARVHAKDTRSMAMFVENNIGLIHHDMGNYAMAKRQYEVALGMADELEHFAGMALAHLNLGLLAIETGNPDEGRDQLEESLSLCRHMKEKWIQAMNRIGLARAYIAKGNIQLARHNAEMAIALSEEMKAKEARGQALRELGRVEELDGRKDEAHKCFKESLDIFEAMNNRYELARSLLIYGQFLLGAGGEASLGKIHIERAVGLAKELGAKGVQKAAEELLKAASA